MSLPYTMQQSDEFSAVNQPNLSLLEYPEFQQAIDIPSDMSESPSWVLSVQVYRRVTPELLADESVVARACTVIRNMLDNPAVYLTRTFTSMHQGHAPNVNGCHYHAICIQENKHTVLHLNARKPINTRDQDDVLIKHVIDYCVSVYTPQMVIPHTNCQE